MPEIEKHIKDLKHEDWKVRKKAAWTLGEIGHVDAVPGLVEALKDEQLFVRENAAISLGQIAHRDAVPGLVEALKDEEEDVRWHAGNALVKIGAPAIRNLARIHEEVKTEEDRQAIEDLIKKVEKGEKMPSEIERHIKNLNHEDWKVRLKAAEALGNSGHLAAVRALTGALSDENEAVFTSVIDGLEKMGVSALQGLIRAHEIAGNNEERERIEGIMKRIWGREDA